MALLKQTKVGNYELLPIPSFKTKLEMERFLENERKLWVEGFLELSGRHYHFLTNGIVEKGRGGYSRPLFRRDDIPVFDLISQMDKEGFDLIIAACRGLGKSLILGEDIAYNARVFEGCKQFVTACDTTRMLDFFKKKLDPRFNKMYKKISPVLGDVSNKSENPSREYKFFSKKFGEPEWLSSYVSGRQTSKTKGDVTNLSGGRGMRITIEEPFLHPFLQSLMSTASEILKEDGVRIGSIFAAGTLEYNSPQECINTLKNLIERADIERAAGVKDHLRFLFLPYTHGKFLREDGSSDVKKAMEHYQKELDKHNLKEDKTDYYDFLKSNPLTIEDALQGSYSGIFTPEMYESIEEQKRKVRSEKIKIEQTKKTAAGTFDLSLNGKIKILQRPIPDVRYIAGIDPIQAVNVASKEGSELVCIIYNTHNNQPVAVYAERSPHSNILAENCIGLLNYYNRAVAMVESNAGNVLIKEFKDRNKTKLLARQPKRLGLAVKETNKQIIYGSRVTGSVRAQEVAHDLLVRELSSNLDNIWFMEILEDIANYPDKNTDYIDAYKQVLIFKRELELRSKYTKHVNVVERTSPYLTPDASGKFVWVKRTYKEYVNDENTQIRGKQNPYRR